MFIITQGDALGLELLPLQGVLDNFKRTGKYCIGCLLNLSSRGHRKQREKTSFVEPLNDRKIMDEKKRQVWRFVIQTAISILTAIATALGVTSCMAAV